MLPQCGYCGQPFSAPLPSHTPLPLGSYLVRTVAMKSLILQESLPPLDELQKFNAAAQVGGRGQHLNGDGWPAFCMGGLCCKVLPGSSADSGAPLGPSQ